jgi:hypothetical protein
VTFVDLRCACTVCSTTWRRAIHEVNKHADYPYRYSTCDSRDNNASRGSARVRPRGSQRGTCTSSLPRYISRRHDELDIQQGNRDHRAQKKNVETRARLIVLKIHHYNTIKLHNRIFSFLVMKRSDPEMTCSISLPKNVPIFGKGCGVSSSDGAVGGVAGQSCVSIPFFTSQETRYFRVRCCT